MSPPSAASAPGGADLRPTEISAGGAESQAGPAAWVIAGLVFALFLGWSFSLGHNDARSQRTLESTAQEVGCTLVGQTFIPGPAARERFGVKRGSSCSYGRIGTVAIFEFDSPEQARRYPVNIPAMTMTSENFLFVSTNFQVTNRVQGALRAAA